MRSENFLHSVADLQHCAFFVVLFVFGEWYYFGSVNLEVGDRSVELADFPVDFEYGCAVRAVVLDEFFDRALALLGSDGKILDKLVGC